MTKEKNCPYCDEKIRLKAKICRFCGRNIEAYNAKNTETNNNSNIHGSPNKDKSADIDEASEDRVDSNVLLKAIGVGATLGVLLAAFAWSNSEPASINDINKCKKNISYQTGYYTDLMEYTGGSKNNIEFYYITSTNKIHWNLRCKNGVVGFKKPSSTTWIEF